MKAVKCECCGAPMKYGQRKCDYCEAEYGSDSFFIIGSAFDAALPMPSATCAVPLHRDVLRGIE